MGKKYYSNLSAYSFENDEAYKALAKETENSEHPGYDTIWRAIFEVFGHINTPSYRKHLREEARRLEIKGYCKYKYKNAIEGEIQGTFNEFNDMKRWLAHVGSPDCRILGASFEEESQIENYNYKQFTIKRNKDL